MSKKPTKPIDPLDIPDYLKRTAQNAPSFHHPAAPAGTSQEAPKSAFHLPKGMTQEEYDKLQQKLDPQRAPKPPKTNKPAKPPRVRKPKPPANTFKIADWARDSNQDPRHVRRVARAIAPELSKLYVHVDGHSLKYVFDNKDKEKVADMIQKGFASETKRTVRTSSPRKTHIPPPSETVWSGKVRLEKKEPKPTKNKAAKTELRKEAARAVKKHGKRNITKVPARRK